MEAGRAPPRRPSLRPLAATAALTLGLALLLRATVAEPFHVPSGSMAPTLLPGDQVLVSRLAYAVRLPFTSLTLLELAAPRRGDVVVFRDPEEPSRRLARRVVGLPGEIVELREQRLLLDGAPQPRLDLGEFMDLEPGAGGVPGRADTCRRWRELLDLGPPRAAGAAPDEPPDEASAWAAGQARLLAHEATGHDLLQCRRVRAGRTEGPYGPVQPGHLFVLADNRDRGADSRAGWEVPLSAVVGRATLLAWSWGPGGWWPWGGAGVRFDRLFKPVE